MPMRGARVYMDVPTHARLKELSSEAESTQAEFLRTLLDSDAARRHAGKLKDLRAAQEAMAQEVLGTGDGS